MPPLKGRALVDELCFKLPTYLQEQLGVTQIQVDARAGCTAADLDGFERNTGYALPADLRAFLAVSNGLKCDWAVDVKTRGPADVGALRLHRLDDIVPVTLDDDEADDEGAPDAPGEDPGDLPWRECFDDARGRNYFFNVFTGESRWRPPAAPYVPYSPRRAERGPADAAGPGDSEALGPALVASSGSFLWRRSEGSRHRARGRHRSLSSLNPRLGMLLRGSVPWQTSRLGELNANPHAGARSLPFLGERSMLPAREFIPSQKEASSWRLNSKRVAWPRHRRGTEKLEALPPPVARPPNRTRDLLRKTSLSGAFGKPACLLKQARELAPAAADAVEARRGELRAAMVAFAARGDARGARAVWLLHELERDLVRRWGLVDGDRTATLSAVAAELLRRLVIVI